jgi:hypothetical protein
MLLAPLKIPVQLQYTKKQLSCVRGDLYMMTADGEQTVMRDAIPLGDDVVTGDARSGKDGCRVPFSVPWAACKPECLSAS